MDLERIMLLIIVSFYGVWGLLLISHSLFQMRGKPKKSTLRENENPTTASLDKDESKHITLHR
jgi:hypothetical protein